MPYLFIDCNKKRKPIIKKEFFFPIISLQSFQNIKEATKLANDSEYGLGSYIFSKNYKEIKYLKNNLLFGRIWINSSLKYWHPSLPVSYC